MEKRYVNGEIHTNTIEGFWSWLKKAIKGTFHSTSRKHLPRYLNEFVFKYNFRNLSDWQRFESTLKRCNVRLQYKALIDDQTEIEKAQKRHSRKNEQVV